MLYVGKYPQIYPHTILRLGIVSRDGLPRGTLPSGILKLEKYCPGLKVRHPIRSMTRIADRTSHYHITNINIESCLI